MTKYLLLSALLFAACGDDSNSDDTMDADDMADMDADDMDADDTDDVMPEASRAVVAAGDFMAGAPGVLSTLDLADNTVEQNVAPTGAVASDAMLRHAGNSLYVVNRLGSNSVTILSADDYSLEQQISTGANSNPQDVAVVGTKLYIPALGTAGVVVATTGSSTTTTIALPTVDTVDNLPDCVSAIAVGTDVYVACGRLDENFMPRGVGKLVVIDTTNDTVKTTVDFTNANPFGTFEQLPDGSLVIPTVPAFGTTGCVEKVVPGTTPTVSCLIPHTELPAFAGRLAPQELEGGGALLWLVASSFPAGSLWGFDLETNTLWSAAISAETQAISDVVACPDGKVVVSDTTMAANGLRVYDGTTEVTTAPLAVGIAPSFAHGLVCY